MDPITDEGSEKQEGNQRLREVSLLTILALIAICVGGVQLASPKFQVGEGIAPPPQLVYIMNFIAVL